jgi:hypothetical protein
MNNPTLCIPVLLFIAKSTMSPALIPDHAVMPVFEALN